MRTWKPKSLLVGVVALSLAGARNATANPVSVSYVEVANQCEAPLNVTLAEELGPAPPFLAGEIITYTVAHATAGDCNIPPDPDGKVNDGCPAVGPAESGAQCDNNIDDDGDGKVNDGCPAVGPAESNQCDNNTDDDGDGKVNDGCPAVGPAESNQCDNNTDDDGDGKVNDGCPAVGPAESGAQCDNNTDDDGDGKVNDGCPAVGLAESNQCDNNTDDDGDGKVNDGCPAVGLAESNQCDNNTDDDFNDYEITATNMSGHCLEDVFVVADTGTTFGNWDGTIAGLPAKRIVVKTWGDNDTISFRLMNVAPNPPSFNSLGVPSSDSASNFSIVANFGGLSLGACCSLVGNQCSQLSACECMARGKDFTYRGDGSPCGPAGTCIPTLSQWGIVVMAVLVLTAGTVVVMRRRAMVRGGS